MMKTPGAILLLAALLGSYEAHPVEGEDYPEGAPHPGTCPPNIFMCRLPPRPRPCKSDNECLKTQKCCDVCGKKCVDGVREKSGFCPKVKYTCEIFPLPRTCNSDTDCDGIQKCCQHSCGFGCTDPVSTDHAGSCPPPPFVHVPIACIPSLNHRTCQDDSSCAEYEKCCEQICGKICVKS